MLGRTRPASRILLWPRSKTRAVRFITTIPASLNHAPKVECQHEDAREDAVSSSPQKRTFKGIRKLDSGLKDTAVLWAGKYTIRRVTGNTAPAMPRGSRETVERALGEHGNARTHTRWKKRWAPVRRIAAEDGPNWAEEHGFRRPVERSGRTEPVLQTESVRNKFPGNWGHAAAVEIKSKDPSGPWTPFSPNPDLVTRKPPPPAHSWSPTSPSASSPQKKNFEVEPQDGAPSRSKILGEMMTWDFEGQPTETGEQSTETSDPVLQDDGPPRSKIIEEMRAWNYVPPVTETDSGEQAHASQTPPRAREGTTEELPPLDREFRRWLKIATETAVREAELNRSLTKGVAVYDGPTVLVLNGASRSLLESDFYRLARQGKHLGDWAVGIARVVQARDPSTCEPLGKYYIFFHTRTAALAYSEEVWRLHLLSRRAAQLISTSLSSSPGSSIPSPLPLTPTLATEQRDLDAALRGYTLLPHSVMLDLKLHLCKDLPLPAEDVLSAMHRASDSPGLSQEHCFVLVSLEGCKTTVAALHDAITRDGEERRLPWGLAARENGKPSIAAVVPDRGSEADISWSGGDGGDGRFWRFIVPFAEAAEARRFVRNWHRREMRDPEGRNMVVTFNVTALW